MGRFLAEHPLTRNSQLRAWRRVLRWQIESRLKEEVIVPWVGGQKLAVRRHMTGATGNIYAGLHEFADMGLVLHFLRRGDLFFDVGSNVGTYSVLASGVCGATTWAFEPHPETVLRLERNVAINHLSDRIKIYQLALGSEAAEVSFTIGLDTMNKVSNDGTGSLKVIQKPLDALVNDAFPIMIKVDVEGYEEDVVRGALSVLANSHLRVVELETVTPWTLKTMKDHGFEQAYYNPILRTLSSQSNFAGPSNTTFIRDPDFVADRVKSAEAIQIFDRLI
ncbi:FkbM family methyltransferase [Mesorhizobium sp. M1273]|uniref:FkbM family methyltransferase n=1 Tax=unclassified Mesorhizobium TaxID=325217 RepID=UPI00333C7E27